MRTNIRGGGGSSPPFATSRVNMFATGSVTIADSATDGVPFTTLATLPDVTPDYTLLADNGDGTPGLRVNKDGFYLLEYTMQPLTLVGGSITIFLDLSFSYGGIHPSSFDVTAAQVADTNGVNKLGTYFTAVSQGLDAIGVFISNNSGASITIPSASIHLYLTRIAPSPLP